MKSLWMLSASFFFALMATFVKLGGLELGTLELIFYRSCFGFTMISLWGIASHKSFKTPVPLVHFRRAFFGTLTMILWFYAITLLPLATATSLTYASPLFVGAFTLAQTVRDKNPIPWLLLGILCMGFAGVIVVLDPSFGNVGFVSALAGASSGFFSAIAVWEVHALRMAKEPGWRIVFYLTMMGTITGFIGTFIERGGFTPLAFSTLLTILCICVCATMAQLLMSQAWGSKNVILTGTLQFSTIIFTVFFGLIFFNEAITTRASIGIALIIAAGILSSLVTRRMK